MASKWDGWRWDRKLEALIVPSLPKRMEREVEADEIREEFEADLEKLKMEAGVKLQMQLKKEWLQIKCREAGLLDEGTKLELAKRLAEHESKKFSQAWDVISGGSRK